MCGSKGFLRKDIVEELSRFELAGLTQPHLPDTQSPDSARAVEEAVFTDADRTDAERLRAFAGDVRMLAAQRLVGSWSWNGTSMVRGLISERSYP